jgi:multidrug efflux system membrane fusion protein
LPVYALDRALKTRIATGVLIAIDNQIDTTTGTVKLRACFANENEALFPNQFVNARLRVKVLSGVTLIPSNAIQHTGQQAFVFAIEDGKAEIHNIKTGVSEDNVTAVEGIRPGTVVATSNFEKLQKGTPVTPVKTQPPSSAKETGEP